MRENYLSWDEYFMGIALLSAMRSKDPQTQVGACIVNEDNRIVGIGYNGFPHGCSDVEFPWEREGEFLETKYPYVVHAEQNAILNSTTRLKKYALYLLKPHLPNFELILRRKDYGLHLFPNPHYRHRKHVYTLMLLHHQLL